jgi:1-acyl-sn-glycerol-3-phosphate acyltransferase
LRAAADARQMRVLQALGSGFVHLVGRIQSENLERIPGRGPVLLAMNHCSLWDGPLLCGLTARPVACLVKAEAFKPVLGPLLLRAGQVPVHRFVVDPAPVRLCMRILDAGGVVGIFPEGTRGRGLDKQVRPGIGYLALRCGATVVPVVCTGSGTLLRGLRRGRVTLTAGLPIEFARVPAGTRINRRAAAHASETVRVAMAELAELARLARLAAIARR